MGDIILVEGNNEQNLVLQPIVVAPLGRIGKWSYTVTVSRPTVHREKGDWLNHSLDFDFDLYPSTFHIDIICHNDSNSSVVATLDIADTNTILHRQPSAKFTPNIGAHKSAPFSFSINLPRTPGDYYFDAVLSFDGVIVDEGRWVIRYH